MKYDDPFYDLCLIAEKEKWCGNIFCTTCGHMYYRYAFKELSNGIKPGSKDWIVIKGKRRLCSEKYPNIHQDVDLINKEQIQLAEIVSKTNIVKLFADFGNSDIWLEALGLVLRKVENNLDALILLTETLVPQLRELEIVSRNEVKFLLYELNGNYWDDTLRWSHIDSISKYIKK